MRSSHIEFFRRRDISISEVRVGASDKLAVGLLLDWVRRLRVDRCHRLLAFGVRGSTVSGRQTTVRMTPSFFCSSTSLLMLSEYSARLHSSSV
jgi:hypothetical protein